MKFKQIIGGTEEEALAKFPWLEEATFTDAVIDITGKYLVWIDGIWENGTWGGGTWTGGYLEGIILKGGYWEGSTWRGGKMWSNIFQRYEEVVYENGSFSIKE